MKIKTIDINGQSIRVAVREGIITTPLLMFNGIGASLELVMPFVAELHPDLEVIIFDVPGVGGSPTPPLPYRFSDLTWTVALMLDQLGYKQVDVLGLSWGGFLAQQFAHDYPQQCRKLILAATSMGSYGTKPPSMKVLGLMSNTRRYTDPEYAMQVVPDIYGGQFRYNKELAASHVKKMVSAKRKSRLDQGYAYQFLAVCLWSSLPWVHKLKQPTLILAGNDDPIIPLYNMEQLAGRISNSELHVFDDGHLFLLTDFPKVVPIITTFLQ